MKRKITVLLILLAMLMNTMAFAVPVNVDGKTQDLNIQVANGRSYIAASELKPYGLSVSIRQNKIHLRGEGLHMIFTVNDSKVSVNQANMTVDSKPFIDAQTGEAFVPFRFVMETLGHEVGYDARRQRITLKEKQPVRYPVTVSIGGEEVLVKKPVNTIVSLAPSITESLFAIGAGDKVVARTQFCNYPKSVLEIRTVGSLWEPDVEGIIDLQPDMVIGATHINEDSLKLFKRAGIQSLKDPAPEKIEGIYHTIEVLGKVTGHNYEAQALNSSLRAKEQRVEQVTSRINNKRTVYYVVGTGDNEFTAGGNTFIHEVLSKSGVKNVAADVTGWGYSLEKLIDQDPQYILGQAWAKDIMTSNANYRSLSAVKNNRFLVVDGDVFSRPGPRIIEEGMKTIIELIYPSLAPELFY